jgi:hypothetical protein
LGTGGRPIRVDETSRRPDPISSSLPGLSRQSSL